MAGAPLKNESPRASSVLSQTATAASAGAKPGPAGAPATITTKSWMTLRRVFFTTADVAAPEKLWNILNRMQEATLAVLGVVSTNALVPGNILRGVALTAGQTAVLTHGLGRPWQGYVIVRAQGAVNFLIDGAYPAGLTADVAVPLLSAATGTYDIYVF